MNVWKSLKPSKLSVGCLDRLSPGAFNRISDLNKYLKFRKELIKIANIFGAQFADGSIITRKTLILKELLKQWEATGPLYSDLGRWAVSTWKHAQESLCTTTAEKAIYLTDCQFWFLRGHKPALLRSCAWPRELRIRFLISCKMRLRKAISGNCSRQ